MKPTDVTEILPNSNSTDFSISDANTAGNSDTADTSSVVAGTDTSEIGALREAVDRIETTVREIETNFLEQFHEFINCTLFKFQHPPVIISTTFRIFLLVVKFSIARRYLSRLLLKKR